MADKKFKEKTTKEEKSTVNLKSELDALEKEIIHTKRNILERVNKTVKIEKIKLKKLLYQKKKLFKKIKDSQATA